MGNQETAVSFKISPNQLKDIVRQICTIDGLPFNTFEKTGMKQLIQPIIDQLKKNINVRERFSLNSPGVRQIVLEGASTRKKEMITDFHGKLLCLKFDLATRLRRHFIALNVQYCNDQKQICKTLAVREVKSVATGNELSRIILDILNDFDIELSQIYSITTDNGSKSLLSAI